MSTTTSALLLSWVLAVVEQPGCSQKEFFTLPAGFKRMSASPTRLEQNELPPGFQRVTEASQYVDSISLSFYSHEETPSEREQIYGHPDSSYSFENEPPDRELPPRQMVQILQTKALDPYLTYRAVKAEFELEPKYRMGVWNRIGLHPIAVYRALTNFNMTKEAIYRSMKKAHKLKLFTEPPKELWIAMHDSDPNYDENLNKAAKRLGWTLSTPPPTTRGARKQVTVSASDQLIVSRFKQKARVIARALKDKDIDYHLAYEVCRAESVFSKIEASLIFEKMKMKPDDVYGVILRQFNMNKLEALRILKYLAESLELFRKPLGPSPDLDGAQHPELYDQTYAIPSEEDHHVLNTYINFIPPNNQYKRSLLMRNTTEMSWTAFEKLLL